MGITRVLVCQPRRDRPAGLRPPAGGWDLGTVAVYTDPDATAPHVADADARVRLTKTNDYLNAEAIIAAARAAGADAVHPGYGFLSENADFASAVQDAGLTWVGPPVDAVAGDGLQESSPRSSCPRPGVTGARRTRPRLDHRSAAAGAGQGFRGRRWSRNASGTRVIRSCRAKSPRRSAKHSPLWRSDRVLRALFADRPPRGGSGPRATPTAPCGAVGERECSIQRRHQKIIEEAPSPLVERTVGMRAKLFDAARLAASAIGYAGCRDGGSSSPTTNGEFFFLEMNTRLQVEHPVTEETTGLDLVELQLAVADGGRLDAEPPAAQGHSIEARVYAEDPAHGCSRKPAWCTPSTCRALGRSSARWASAPESVWTPALSMDRPSRFTTTPCWPRFISYAPTRRQSALVLADALARTRLHGLRTNRELLVKRVSASGIYRRCHRHRIFRHARRGTAVGTAGRRRRRPFVGDCRRARRGRAQSRDRRRVRPDAQWLAKT